MAVGLWEPHRVMDEGHQAVGSASDGTNRSRTTGALAVGGATAVALAVLGWSWRAFGPGSRRFAVVSVWAPMVWLGTISRVVTPRLPAGWHELRGFERGGGRIYELLGVRVAKATLRRGPLARFNPDLHLPAERTPERIAHLDQRMRDAEASHTILFLVTTGVAVVARFAGARTAARWMLAANIVMNGYPVMLQRYNRGVLAAKTATRPSGGRSADCCTSTTRNTGPPTPGHQSTGARRWAPRQAP